MANNTKKIIGWSIFGFLLLLGGGIVAWVVRRNSCDPNNKGYKRNGTLSDKCAGKVQDPKQSNTPPPIGSPNWVADDTFPLKKGMWGPKVRTLQKALGFPEGDCGTCADGKFGTNTESAVYAKFKTNDVSKPQYDTLIGGAPTAPKGGGENFQNVIKSLGAGGVLTTNGQGVYTQVQGENTTYNVTFYNNGRVSFKNNSTNKFYNGYYKEGGKEIGIDNASGGSSSEEDSVYLAMKDIISQIESN